MKKRIFPKTLLFFLLLIVPITSIVGMQYTPEHRIAFYNGIEILDEYMKKYPAHTIITTLKQAYENQESSYFFALANIQDKEQKQKIRINLLSLEFAQLHYTVKLIVQNHRCTKQSTDA